MGDVGGGSTRLLRAVVADHLRQVVDRYEISGLAGNEIAVEPRGQLESPPLLRRIGDLHGDPLFHSGYVEWSALEHDLCGASSRIQGAAGMARRACPGIVSGGGRHSRRRTITMSEGGNWN